MVFERKLTSLAWLPQIYITGQNLSTPAKTKRKHAHTNTHTPRRTRFPSCTNFSLLKHSLVSFSNNTSRANANPHITLLSRLRLVNKIMSLFTNSLGAFEPLYIKPGPCSWVKLKDKNLETVSVSLDRGN